MDEACLFLLFSAYLFAIIQVAETYENMHPATKSFSSDETSTTPLACIDAQEELFILPLREYLEANGCRVVLGSSLNDSVMYHIVVGDVRFVKHIFSLPKNTALRTLGIVVGSSLSDAETLSTANRKIVVVDPIAFGDEDVVEIFSFFFAGIDEVFDKRRSRHDPVIEDKKIEDVKMGDDERRIGSIIADVFGTHKRYKKRKKLKWSRIALVLVIIAMPVVWYIGSIAGTMVSFASAAKAMKTGNMTIANRFENLGGYWLRQSRFSFTLVRMPLSVLGLKTTIRGQERMLSFLGDTESAFAATDDVIREGKVAASVIISNSTTQSQKSPAVVLDELRLSVAALAGSLGLAQAELGVVLSDQTFPFSIPIVGRMGNSALIEISTMRNQLSRAESLLLLYPRIAGFVEPKTYLVLLQNSAELRPTGGFIGSIGKLTFDGGVMRDFTIQDVYAIDGQLKGHVDPPLPIRELLSQEHWYLRDSNWDPDFRVSGEKAAWFYEKETGESVDGVIALSLPLIVDVLRITGPIQLADYNDQITAENFLGKSIYYTKNNFFPGSTAKSDFLGTLARTLLLRLTTDTHLHPMSIFAALVDGLESHDIQFMFPNNELQELVEHFAWAGRMPTNEGCGASDAGACIADPLIVNEANMSVSKVNAFVKHTNYREIVIAPDGGVTESDTVTLENTANNDEPGVGGNYRTYIRFFLPHDALVQDITLDGAPVPSRSAKTELPSLPYKEQAPSPEGFHGIGVGLDVPRGTNKRLRITYARGSKLTVDGGVLAVVQKKQAGIDDVAQTIMIHFPVGWKAESTPMVVAKDGQLEYTTVLSKDARLRITFTK